MTPADLRAAYTLTPTRHPLLHIARFRTSGDVHWRHAVIDDDDAYITGPVYRSQAEAFTDLATSIDRVTEPAPVQR